MSIRYLTAKLAQQIDEELMNAAGAFSIDQLMELAGLACAQTLATVYGKERYPRVLVCCGPGNQGGDGLVAARHLGMFGYKPTVWIPKIGSKDIYKRLHRQCTNMHIPTLPASDEDSTPAENALSAALASSDVVLDAIFGFSFKPPVRAPFDAALPLIARSGLPIVSVDIPSGWDVERGDAGAGAGEGGGGGPGGAAAVRVVLRPDVLVSLTAPKEGVRRFLGRHFLGGRFVPKSLEEKYELNLPSYPGFAQIVELAQPERDGDPSQKL
ncbi:YjeF N-terminal domain-like protein [Russula earlei]|uniref:YjeF N-terminal domain-like protein n=1 Tax=Russula earlei TaxID=71964 RepID=A0ACC0U417_9AGAM|nr:YjeF N-terminal domain-like protein [Russula earlei]